MNRVICLNCRQPVRSLAEHVRDTGAATTVPDGACPVLFAARNPHLFIDDIDVQRLLKRAVRPFDWQRDDVQLALDLDPLPDLVDADGFLYTPVG